MPKAAIYLRVSTTLKTRPTADAAYEQNPAVQEAPLRQLAAQRGWTIHRVYSDRASGAKDNRPGLQSLMQDARRGEFGVVLVWRFDRFARSVEQLVTALVEFRTVGIDFVATRVLPSKRADLRCEATIGPPLAQRPGSIISSGARPR